MEDNEYYNYSDKSTYGGYYGSTGAVSLGRRRSSFLVSASEGDIESPRLLFSIGEGTATERAMTSKQT